MFYIISTLLFLISPISGLLFAFFFLLIRQKISLQQVGFFILLFSLLLGIINAGKVPESDLEIYQLWYEDVPNHNFFNYLFYIDKEPLFFLYNYVLYYTSFGSFEFYLVQHTAICYSIMGYAFLQMHKAFKFPLEFLLIGLLVLFLFPNLFSLSVHLNRQFLAASLLILFVVNFTFYDKNNIVLLVTAIFIHTSSIIYSIIFFLKNLKVTKYTIVLYSLIFGVVFSIIFKYSSLFLLSSLNSDILNYGITRIQDRKNAIELENLGVLNYILFIFIVVVFYKLSKQLKSKKRGVLLFLSVLFLTFITLNFSDTELALRFSFFMYFLFPISIYFFFKIFKLEKFTKLGSRNDVVILFAFVFLSWFLYKLQNGAWQYLNTKKLLFSGFWL